MTDILIRDVPDDVLAAIDAKAQRAGLSPHASTCGALLPVSAATTRAR